MVSGHYSEETLEPQNCLVTSVQVARKVAAVTV